MISQVSQKDIDTLDFIGTNLKRIADTAREKGPFGSMRSLKLQLVQVQAVLDILEKEPLEDTVPRDVRLKCEYRVDATNDFLVVVYSYGAKCSRLFTGLSMRRRTSWRCAKLR